MYLNSRWSLYWGFVVCGPVKGVATNPRQVKLGLGIPSTKTIFSLRPFLLRKNIRFFSELWFLHHNFFYSLKNTQREQMFYKYFNSINKVWIRTNLIYFEKATNFSKNWLEFLPNLNYFNSKMIIEEVNMMSFLRFLLTSQNIWTWTYFNLKSSWGTRN